MRILVTRRPAASYGSLAQSLLIGRIYNLDASVASALLADGCAELYETMNDTARQQTRPRGLWQSADRTRPWSRNLAEPDDSDYSK